MHHVHDDPNPPANTSRCSTLNISGGVSCKGYPSVCCQWRTVAGSANIDLAAQFLRRTSRSLVTDRFALCSRLGTFKISYLCLGRSKDQNRTRGESPWLSSSKIISMVNGFLLKR